MRLKLERGLLVWFVRPSRTVRANSEKITLTATRHHQKHSYFKSFAFAGTFRLPLQLQKAAGVVHGDGDLTLTASDWQQVNQFTQCAALSFRDGSE